MNKNLKNIIENGIKDWIEPKIDNSHKLIYRVASKVKYHQKENEIPINLSINLPNKVYNLYTVIDFGYFFKDLEYDQWGLRIFSLQECREKSNFWRKNIAESFDSKRWVIGEFLGDSDLLIFDERCSSVLVVDSAVGDKYWEIVGTDFSDFFSEYFKYPNDKFWEL